MFELFAFGEATTFNLLRPLVKQIAFFAFVKQNSLVWHLIFLVRCNICSVHPGECQCGNFKLKLTIIQ